MDIDIFDEKLASFYEELTYSQEELGAEFSKVLFDFFRGQVGRRPGGCRYARPHGKTR